MLRRTMLVATLAVGIAIGSCDSPTGEGGVLGTEPISGVSPAAVSPRMSVLDATAVGTTGCVAQGSGMLRIVASADDCKANEQAIVLGGGLVGYEIVTRDHLPQTVPSSVTGALVIDCPTGKRVLGGGASALLDLSGGGPEPSLSGAASFERGSYPQDEDTWVAGFSYTASGGSLKGVRGFAVCAY